MDEQLEQIKDKVLSAISIAHRSDLKDLRTSLVESSLSIKNSSERIQSYLSEIRQLEAKAVYDAEQPVVEPAPIFETPITAESKEPKKNTIFSLLSAIGGFFMGFLSLIGKIGKMIFVPFFKGIGSLLKTAFKSILKVRSIALAARAITKFLPTKSVLALGRAFKALRALTSVLAVAGALVYGVGPNSFTVKRRQFYATRYKRRAKIATMRFIASARSKGLPLVTAVKRAVSALGKFFVRVVPGVGAVAAFGSLMSEIYDIASDYYTKDSQEAKDFLSRQEQYAELDERQAEIDFRKSYKLTSEDIAAVNQSAGTTFKYNTDGSVDLGIEEEKQENIPPRTEPVKQVITDNIPSMPTVKEVTQKILDDKKYKNTLEDVFSEGGKTFNNIFINNNFTAIAQ